MELRKTPMEFKKEPLRYICNEAFFAVRRLFPASWSHAPIAFFEGALAGYIAAEIGSHLVPESKLEQIASHSLTATIAIPVSSYALAPRYWKSWRREQPTYASGVLGVMTGASLRALQEIMF